MPGAEATCVTVAGDGFTLLSRSRDDTLKVRSAVRVVPRCS
jgi:hypothetical protein